MLGRPCSSLCQCVDCSNYNGQIVPEEDIINREIKNGSSGIMKEDN